MRLFPSIAKQKQHQSLTHKRFHDIQIPELSGEIDKIPIENFVGMTQIPTGLAGPIALNGKYAQGEFFLPLATTEGALVASYHRGTKTINRSGGAEVLCYEQSVHRSPLFAFKTLQELSHFLSWGVAQMSVFQKITQEHTRFGELKSITPTIEGNNLILTFSYETADAAGQNMVTFCTEAICQFIEKNSPVAIQHWYLESNFSGDKKATALSFLRGRGRKVTAQVVVPRNIVATLLKSSPESMTAYWRASTLAITQSGAFGAQGHFANGLAALFLATGQDVACVAEAATGITRMEINENGDLYASVSLPNLIVGTVGGGTGLPTQTYCLEVMDCRGAGKANKYAEICAGLLLAGELSIAAALAEGHFARAHKQLGRK